MLSSFFLMSSMAFCCSTACVCVSSWDLSAFSVAVWMSRLVQPLACIFFSNAAATSGDILPEIYARIAFEDCFTESR